MTKIDILRKILLIVESSEESKTYPLHLSPWVTLKAIKHLSCEDVEIAANSTKSKKIKVQLFSIIVAAFRALMELPDHENQR